MKNLLQKRDLLKFLEESLNDEQKVAPFGLSKDSQTKNIIAFLQNYNEESISIIDYGCGNMRLAKGLIESNHWDTIEYIGCDFEERYNSLEESVKPFFKSYKEVKAEYNDAFDVAIMTNTIHEMNIYDFSCAVETLRRVLKNDGCLVLMDMSILAEGEALGCPYYSWEIGSLFRYYEDKSYVTKSNIPILYLIVKKMDIPSYPDLRLSMSRLTKERVDFYSDLSSFLHKKDKQVESILRLMSLGEDLAHDLGYLNLIAGYSNTQRRREKSRIEMFARKTFVDDPMYREFTNLSYEIIVYLENECDQRAKKPFIREIFDVFGSRYDYESILYSLAILSGGQPFSYSANDGSFSLPMSKGFIFPISERMTPKVDRWENLISNVQVTLTTMYDIYRSHFNREYLFEHGIYKTMGDVYNLGVEIGELT